MASIARTVRAAEAADEGEPEGDGDGEQEQEDNQLVQPKKKKKAEPKKKPEPKKKEKKKEKGKVLAMQPKGKGKGKGKAKSTSGFAFRRGALDPGQIHPVATPEDILSFIRARKTVYVQGACSAFLPQTGKSNSLALRWNPPRV